LRLTLPELPRHLGTRFSIGLRPPSRSARRNVDEAEVGAETSSTDYGVVRLTMVAEIGRIQVVGPGDSGRVVAKKALVGGRIGDAEISSTVVVSNEARARAPHS